jgi:hypothetical protein
MTRFEIFNSLREIHDKLRMIVNDPDPDFLRTSDQEWLTEVKNEVEEMLDTYS